MEEERRTERGKKEGREGGMEGGQEQRSVKLKTKKQQRKINETTTWVFEKIKKIDKLLLKWKSEKRKKTQIANIRKERGNFTQSLTDTKG